MRTFQIDFTAVSRDITYELSAVSTPEPNVPLFIYIHKGGERVGVARLVPPLSIFHGWSKELADKALARVDIPILIESALGFEETAPFVVQLE